MFMRLWAHRLNISIVEDNRSLSRTMKEILRTLPGNSNAHLTAAEAWRVQKWPATRKSPNLESRQARSFSPLPCSPNFCSKTATASEARRTGDRLEMGCSPHRVAHGLGGKCGIMEANEFSLDNKDSPPRFGSNQPGVAVEGVETAPSMRIGQINEIALERKDKASHSIIFRPGAAGSLFPRISSNREKSGGAIHRASTQSHAGGRVRDAR